MQEVDIIEKKDIREQLMTRIEILNKVKKLFLIPQLEVMTVKQVAEYFEVDSNTLEMCYKRNKDEIDPDGVTLKSINEIKGVHLVPIRITQGKTIFQIEDGITFEIPNRGIKCFSKRAILRIAMLLRDSEVAKEVRTQLLNTFEHSTYKQKTFDINEELTIQADIGRAYMSGDPQTIMLACTKAMDFKNRHISLLESKNKELTNNNKALAGEILKWSERSSVNKAVRLIAGIANIYVAKIWKELYDELYYKYHIQLTKRGEKPYIQHVKEYEWEFVIKSLSAICEKYGISSSSIFSESKINSRSE